MTKYFEFDLIFEEMTPEQAAELYEIITDYAEAHSLDMAGLPWPATDLDCPPWLLLIDRFTAWTIRVWKVLHGKKDA